MDKLRNFIETQKLTQAIAAKILCVSQYRVSVWDRQYAISGKKPTCPDRYSKTMYHTYSFLKSSMS